MHCGLSPGGWILIAIRVTLLLLLPLQVCPGRWRQLHPGCAGEGRADGMRRLLSPELLT